MFFKLRRHRLYLFFLFRPPRNLENETDFKIWCNCNVIICYGSVIYLCICIDKFLSCENIVLRWNVPLIRGKASVEKNPTLFQITHNYQGRRYLAPLKKKIILVHFYEIISIPISPSPIPQCIVAVFKIKTKLHLLVQYINNTCLMF